ncbi:MAG TPA: demethylmenaquinone methyltransferase [Streptosporangiaceae bacterium]|jgi:demethylmenaquinone methyltransferase/2-methoxy-6-polyprenyl-1,4-benzoquinol methylase|nr:demethylmenaquinone methyltransferase [Streptosporangiaceae bacterium]
MTRAHLDKRPGDVSAMFDAVAGRYDLLNDVLSAGQDRWWRRVVARTVGGRAGERVLDLAAGTGTSSRSFTTAGADCVACDFSLGMLREGKRRLAAAAVPVDVPGPAPPGEVAFIAGDALRLPFRDQAFDAVTISFGLRNVADPRSALAELLRVTRPGGRLVICEFGHLPWPRVNALYERYLTMVLPAIAKRLSAAGDAYDYLAESIRDWPAPDGLARLVSAAGWSAVRWRNLTLGIVCLHTARRPG